MSGARLLQGCGVWVCVVRMREKWRLCECVDVIEHACVRVCVCAHERVIANIAANASNRVKLGSRRTRVGSADKTTTPPNTKCIATFVCTFQVLQLFRDNENFANAPQNHKLKERNAKYKHNQKNVTLQRSCARMHVHFNALHTNCMHVNKIRQFQSNEHTKKHKVRDTNATENTIATFTCVKSDAFHAFHANCQDFTH